MSEKTLLSQVSQIENIIKDIESKLYRTVVGAEESTETASPSSRISFATHRLSECHSSLCKISDALGQISGPSPEDAPKQRG